LNDNEEKETTIRIKEVKGKRKEEKKNYNCTFQNLKGPIDRLHYAFQISKGTMKYLGVRVQNLQCKKLG
jgi:hypothetical protein